MSNKLYRGVRQNHIAKVYIDNAEISLEASKVLRPSDATVEWGYFGDGPSSTALAILLDAIQDYPNADTLALTYYHDFKFEFIASADYNVGFLIFQSQVREWLQKRLDVNKDSKGWNI